MEYNSNTPLRESECLIQDIFTLVNCILVVSRLSDLNYEPMNNNTENRYLSLFSQQNSVYRVYEIGDSFTRFHIFEDLTLKITGLIILSPEITYQNKNIEIVPSQNIYSYEVQTIMAASQCDRQCHQSNNTKF